MYAGTLGEVTLIPLPDNLELHPTLCIGTGLNPDTAVSLAELFDILSGLSSSTKRENVLHLLLWITYRLVSLAATATKAWPVTAHGDIKARIVHSAVEPANLSHRSFRKARHLLLR